MNTIMNEEAEERMHYALQYYIDMVISANNYTWKRKNYYVDL